MYFMPAHKVFLSPTPQQMSIKGAANPLQRPHAHISFTDLFLAPWIKIAVQEYTYFIDVLYIKPVSGFFPEFQSYPESELIWDANISAFIPVAAEFCYKL